MPTSLTITDETPTPSGWSFIVRVSAPPGTDPDAQRRVMLSWVDYDYWSKGVATPARVVEAVMRALVDHAGLDAIRNPFDLSLSRRLCPGIDAEVRRQL